MAKKEDIIEKAVQRKVGDMHPNGKWVWTEYKPGKFDWRPPKKNASGGTDSGSGSSDTSSGGAAKKTATTTTTVKKGKPMDSQKLVQWAAQTSDDNLLKVANNKNGNAQMRMIAYKQLESRGFDMSKVDTSGTLGQLMKMTQGAKSSTTSSQGSEDDTVSGAAAGASVDIDDDTDEGGDDGDQITEKWYLNKNDDRVKKRFNLKTKEGRIKYDQFVYKEKKKEPDYKNPVEVIQDLNEQYLEFLDNPEQRFMISAGGAGIGKSYGFVKTKPSFELVAAFTVSNSMLPVVNFPKSIKNRINRQIPNSKRNSQYPAVLVGQLAVFDSFAGKHIGDEVLSFIKSWFIDPLNKTGCRYIIVDAVNNDKVIKFYKRNGFKFIFDNIEDEIEYMKLDLEPEYKHTRLMYFDLIVLKPVG